MDHTGHDHPATPAGRAECRKITTGIRQGDMIQVRMPAGDLLWGLVMNDPGVNNPNKEFKTQFKDIDQTWYVTRDMIVIVEHRA
jgi:hypothetical protein